MAAHDASHGQPHAFERTISVNRIDGVFTAGGVKLAGADQEGANQSLVASDQENEQLADKLTHGFAR
jgi:hypothetical protein